MRRSLGLASAIAIVWTIAVWVTGGTTIALAGITISSTDPIRPLIAATVLGVVYGLISGRARLADDRRIGASIATPARLAAAFAMAIGLIAVWQGSWTASGADAYAYVTQADSWLAGTLKVPVPLADEVPWPAPLSTFVPFGYAAVAHESAIASAVGPGLPIMMALMKAVAGHCALFLVVPITATLLIWATFAIGRHVGSPWIGLATAWLVGTSPAFLTMIKEPMSDVPAAAFWALATWKVLGDRRRDTTLAGVAAAIAVLIRPNLVPLAGILVVWMVWQRRAWPRRDLAQSILTFAVSVVPACFAIAWINHSLFGSPFRTGYGELASLFSLSYLPANLSRYGQWLAETQTPLVLAGIVALVVPSSHVWPTLAAQQAARLLALFALAVCAMYAFYLPFDAWWFLRLLLPCWPAICLGTVAALRTAALTAGRWHTFVSTTAIVAVGLYTAMVAQRLHVFPEGEGERRYATVAQLVQQATEPSSVILASIHTGPVRYYAGRDTMRFDRLDAAWLDRAIAWLTAHGRHPYILIEDWERPVFEQRFAATSRLGRLALSPVLAYRAYRIPGTVYLFDPARPAADTWAPPPIRDPQPRCALPDTPRPTNGPVAHDTRANCLASLLPRLSW